MTASGRRVAAALGRHPGGTAAVKGRGKSERGPRGFYPLPRLVLGRSGGSCPRMPAAAAELSAAAVLGAWGGSLERRWRSWRR